MVHVFLAYRKANEAIRDKVADAIRALAAIDGGMAWPITLWSDDHLLAGDDWERLVAINIDNADLFLLLVTTASAEGYAVEEELPRAIARARQGHCKIVPVVVDDVIGFLAKHDLQDYALNRIPRGGVGLSQPPYDGDLSAWLADVVEGVKQAVMSILASAQLNGPDLIAERNAFEAAANRARDVARAQGNVLGPEWAFVERAPERALDVLAASTPGLLISLAAAREPAQEARRRAARVGATASVTAFMELTAALDDFVNAARLAGFRDPAVAAANAPEPPILPAAPDNAVDISRYQRDLERVEAAGEGLVEEARTAPPEHAPALREYGHRLAAESRLSRAVSESPAIDGLMLAETSGQLAATARSGEPLRSLGGATARLIGAALRAVARAVVHVTRLVRRSRKEPVPPPPAPEIDEQAWLEAMITPPPISPKRGPWVEPIPGLTRPAWPRLVSLEPGQFMMGSSSREKDWFDRERPAHRVTIRRPFAIGQYPVTFREWDAAIAAGAALETPSDRGWGRDDRPVINVSWYDAQAYLRWLNGRLNLSDRPDAYRLPSEAEWEYACRAGTTTAYSFGDMISSDQARFGSRDGTVPVGNYPPNAWDLYDMHGNVWEWCEDVWHDTYDGAPDDGLPWEEGGVSSRRVLRGGSWRYFPQDLRSAYRGRDDSSNRSFDIGFRLARTLSGRLS